MLATSAKFLARVSGLSSGSARATVHTVAEYRRAKKLQAMRRRREPDIMLWFEWELLPEETGLPVPICISPDLAQEGSEEPHIKVLCKHGTTGPSFAMTMEDNPRIVGDARGLEKEDLELVQLFVQDNKDLLLGVWTRKAVTKADFRRMIRIVD